MKSTKTILKNKIKKLDSFIESVKEAIKSTKLKIKNDVGDILIHEADLNDLENVLKKSKELKIEVEDICE